MNDINEFIKHLQHLDPEEIISAILFIGQTNDKMSLLVAGNGTNTLRGIYATLDKIIGQAPEMGTAILGMVLEICLRSPTSTTSSVESEVAELLKRLQ